MQKKTASLPPLSADHRAAILLVVLTGSSQVPKSAIEEFVAKGTELKIRGMQ